MSRNLPPRPTSYKSRFRFLLGDDTTDRRPTLYFRAAAVYKGFMGGRVTVLASGSSGNAALLEVGDDAWLIDCGLPPHLLGERMAAAGRSWKVVRAVLLTHTHGDHWNRDTLEHLRRLNVPLIAHARHHVTLSSQSTYTPMARAGLVGEYVEGVPLTLAPGVEVRAVRVPHDADPTYGFRFDVAAAGLGWSLAYASDVGHVTPALLDAFAGVDVLAVEYNHDEALQRNSGRHPVLLQRVLGPNGHLSNAQASDLVKTLVGRAAPGRLRHLVQLHLSKDCNTVALARESAQATLDRLRSAALVTTATQHVATTPIEIAPRPLSMGDAAMFPVAAAPRVQPPLPGLSDD